MIARNFNYLPLQLIRLIHHLMCNFILILIRPIFITMSNYDNRAIVRSKFKKIVFFRKSWILKVVCYLNQNHNHDGEVNPCQEKQSVPFSLLFTALTAKITGVSLHCLEK